MYTERFSLSFVNGTVLAAAERRRPGLGPWTAEVRAQLESTVESELAEVRARFLESFDDRAYWTKVEQSVRTVAFPRYCALAEKQTALERADYGLWRGGDLVARGVYALLGFFLGLFLVKATFIPIPQTWDFLAFLMLLAAPLLPDLQVGWHRRKYRKGIEAILSDLTQAQAQLSLYPPMGPSAEPEKIEAPEVKPDRIPPGRIRH